MEKKLWIRGEMDVDYIVDAVAESLSREELVEFIMAVDGEVADYEFTEILTKRLIAALKSDCDPDKPFNFEALLPQ